MVNPTNRCESQKYLNEVLASNEFGFSFNFDIRHVQKRNRIFKLCGSNVNESQVYKIFLLQMGSILHYP